MKRSIAALLAVMLLCGLSTSSFGWEGHYHYREGRYYRDAGWWGLGGFITGLAVGAYVSSLPPRYETVVVAGVPYYYADGYYYQTAPNGYVIVAPPAQVQNNIIGSNAAGSNGTVYILGTLFGIFLLAGIVLIIKNLITK